MPTVDELLNGVLAAPDDDGPRLILADRYADDGDPRGEFIRLQCLAACLPVGDAARVEAERVARELFDTHAVEWMAPFRGWAGGVEFRRGFVEAANVEAKMFLARGAKLFALAPIRHLRLLDVGGSLARVMASPLLTRLDELTIYAQYLGHRLGTALSGSPHLRGLRALRVGRNDWHSAGVEALTDAPWPMLAELDISGNEMEMSGLMALLDAPFVSQLTNLNLSQNYFNSSALDLLLDGRALPRLRSLSLSGNRLARNPPTGEPRADSFASPVESLDLAGNNLTGADVERFTNRFDLPNLRELRLSGNHLGSPGLIALGRSQLFPRLRLLDLSENHINDQGLLACLADAPEGELRELSLTGNPVYGPGLVSMLTAPAARNLRRLKFDRYGVLPALQHALIGRFGN